MMSLRRALGAVIIVITVLAGCSASEADPAATAALADLDAAVALWQSGDRSDYSYIYLRTCRCVRPEPQGPNTVFVIDGEVDKVEHFGLREFLDGFTAEDLYGQIRQAIDDGHHVEVSYDASTGFPTSLNLDPSAGELDDPLILDLHTFLSYADERTGLADARSLWNAAALSSYRLRFETTDTGPVEVEVVGNEWVSDTLGTSSEQQRTIGDLFDQIESSIDERPDVLDVSYDAVLGYPTEYEININLADRGKIHVEAIEVTPTG